MGVKKFISAYFFEENGEIYRTSLENYFKENSLNILNEEKKLVKYVYSIHILFMRTMQWKMNQSQPKLNGIPLNLYLENFKKSIRGQNPSPGYNFSFDHIKKLLNVLLKQDYLNFQKDDREDLKKEEFLNFSLVLEKAYMVDNLQIQFPIFKEGYGDKKVKNYHYNLFL